MKRKLTIIIAEDEIVIVKLLRESLQSNGFSVLAVADGAQALQAVETRLPDLVILDINMPAIDGFEVCRRLREWSQVPIIMLTGQTDEQDKVRCLELGADDYITKPFGVNELIARIKAVLRRTQVIGSIPTPASFVNGDLQINFLDRRVIRGTHEVRLTPTEYGIFQELTLNAGRVLTHKQLLKRIWGAEYEVEREYLHVFIGRLRAKLKMNAESPNRIVTVPGVGYKFEASG